MSLGPQLPADILLAAFALMEFFRPRGTHTRTRREASTDGGSSAVLIGCYSVTVLALNWSTPSPLSLPAWAEWAGIANSLCGLALRQWAMAVLKQHSNAADPGGAPPMLRRGPYRLIRHPGYLSNLAVWSGATAASGNLVALVTLMVAMLAAYAVRISSEEAMLGKAFGAAYDAYRQQSWRLIPFVY